MVAANRDRQIERETQDRERWLQVILKGFFGFALTIITYLILFFESPLVGRSFTFSSFSLSPWVPFFALLAIALVLFRVFSNRWTKRPSTHLIEAIAFIGMVIAPLGFFDEYLWPYALVVSAVGTACLCFLWCLYLCDFSHGMLLSFVSASFAVSAGVVGVLYALNLDQIEFLVCECLTATGSLVLLMLSDVQAGAKLLITTNIESRDRAITTRYDRWTYSAIGLNLGFSLGLVTFLSRSEGFASGARPFTCFVVIFLAAVILLILRPRFDYAFLNYSKNFLVAFVAVFVVIGTLVSLDGQLLCFSCLLLVSCMQIIIAISASVEFIRYEQLSPAWYMFEEMFLMLGMTGGFVLSGLCSMEGEAGSWFFICCGIVVIINCIAQPFINNGFYPTVEKLQDQAEEIKTPSDVREISLLLAQSDTSAIHPVMDSEIQAIPADESENLGEGKGRWKEKIDYLSREYDLTPRQSEIFGFLARGRDARFLEEHFVISNSTAKSHINSIYRKLGVHSRQELIDMVESLDDPSSSKSSS